MTEPGSAATTCTELCAHGRTRAEGCKPCFWVGGQCRCQPASAACPACGGTGIGGQVTREMALDAGEPSMEGMPEPCPLGCSPRVDPADCQGEGRECYVHPGCVRDGQCVLHRDHEGDCDWGGDERDGD